MKRTLLLLAATLLVPGVAQGRLTRFVITGTESPTFGGYSWPGVGQYEKIVGKGFGEVNPFDPKNAVIVDLALAPRNANGNVEYSFDFYILKPVDLRKGAHKVMYEPPNRGNKTWSTLGRFPGGNDPGSVTDPAALANAFFMPRGYTIVFSGWDKSAGTSTANFNSTIALPVAHNPDGSTITGPGFEYIVSPGATFTLSYPAATLDQGSARLTHRVHLDDQPAAIAASGWKYNADGTAISLTTGPFVPNDIYEFSYVARDPTPNAMGLAAIRDFNSWLRTARRDDAGTPNPLAGDVRRIYTEVVSQPGRLLNDFTHLGFNQAENGEQVFDGMLQWIAAGDGLSLNYRFSQPGRTERNRQDHLFNEAIFPIANVMTTDPFTGKRDSRFASCERSHTCPVAMEIYSANEYWVKAASLLHTTPDGTRDLHDSPFARNYFISSHQHGTGNPASKGNCQQLQNPLNSAPVQRALWIAMDEWVTEGRRPPRSQVPTFRDGTLVPPLPQSEMGFPHIPGVTYTGLKTTRYRFDLGPGFYETGIATIYPPLITPPYEDNPANGPIYPSFVPRTDADGNDIAGIRLADVAVPVATYTGWALRAGPQANDGCESAGQFIPFPKKKADRTASGDPRLSVEERYASLADYSARVADALQRLVDRRLLLCEDFPAELNRLIALGRAAGLTDAAGTAAFVAPACQARHARDRDDDD
ncbi:MAG TPA: alpha/beta hydrolase domain-containing protein [Myxococcales bacterium]